MSVTWAGPLSKLSGRAKKLEIQNALRLFHIIREKIIPYEFRALLDQICFRSSRSRHLKIRHRIVDFPVIVLTSPNY
jgi:hypothetical protein